MGTGILSWGQRRLGVGLTMRLHLEEIRNKWSYTVIPPICLHGVGSDDNFTFIFVQGNECKELRKPRTCCVKMGDRVASLPRGSEESDYVQLYNNAATLKGETLAPMFLEHTSTDVINKGGYSTVKQV